MVRVVFEGLPGKENYKGVCFLNKVLTEEKIGHKRLHPPAEMTDIIR